MQNVKVTNYLLEQLTAQRAFSTIRTKYWNKNYSAVGFNEAI